MEAIWDEKKQAKAKQGDSSKRSVSKSFSNPPYKKSKYFNTQPMPLAEKV